MVGKTIGSTVGKPAGNVVGIWPGDAVRSGWEHDREHWPETTVETIEMRKMIPRGICQLLLSIPLVQSTYWYDIILQGKEKGRL